MAGGCLRQGKLEPAQQLTIKWRGKPIWVLRRTEAMLARLKAPAFRDQLRDPDSEVASQQPAYARNEFRSIKPEYLVVVGLCTHLGCVPTFRPDVGPPDLGDDWPGGYFRVTHRYIAEQLIEIGVDPKQA